MTMFSQRNHFDLSEFLKVPASPETRQHIKLLKRRHLLTLQLPETDAVIAVRKPVARKR